MWSINDYLCLSGHHVSQVDVLSEQSLPDEYSGVEASVVNRCIKYISALTDGKLVSCSLVYSSVSVRPRHDARWASQLHLEMNHPGEKLSSSLCCSTSGRTSKYSSEDTKPPVTLSCHSGKSLFIANIYQCKVVFEQWVAIIHLFHWFCSFDLLRRLITRKIRLMCFTTNIWFTNEDFIITKWQYWCFPRVINLTIKKRIISLIKCEIFHSFSKISRNVSICGVSDQLLLKV